MQYKNNLTWLMFINAISGFYSQFKSWPTRIIINEKVLADLRENFITPNALSKIERKVEIIPTDHEVILAENDEGQTFLYGSLLTEISDISAEKWLGVVPDRDRSPS